MELVGLESSKIVTIDITEPSWDPGAQWGGAAVAREDPTKNKMWQKRVTFIKVGRGTGGRAGGRRDGGKGERGERKAG